MKYTRVFTRLISLLLLSVSVHKRYIAPMFYTQSNFPTDSLMFNGFLLCIVFQFYSGLLFSILNDCAHPACSMMNVIYQIESQSTWKKATFDIYKLIISLWKSAWVSIKAERSTFDELFI